MSNTFNFKNICVLGAGISGQSTLNALRKLGKKATLFSDGLDSSDALKIPFDNQFDLLIKSPGIPNEHSYIQKALSLEIPVWTEIELGYVFAKAPIIAITGTNGKTTTTLMAQYLLEKMGKSVFCGGNIGKPFCEHILEDKNYDCYLLELSSFQLEHINEFRADYAALLNISSSHEERYKSFSEYKKAKLNIFKNSNENDLKLEDSQVNLDDLGSFDFSSFKLKGEFQKHNIWFAKTLVEAFSNEKAPVQDLINDFKGAPFRLEYQGIYKNLSIYNDSKSTNWQATFSALNAFEGKVHLVLGGKKRSEVKLDKSLKEAIDQRTKSIFLIGETANELKEIFSKAIIVENLEQLKVYIAKNKISGELLFSPAFPSFDQFKDYIERGEAFKELFSS